MPKSNSDLIDQYIQTGATGNWGVPTSNAQLSPRSGILSRLQDMIYGSEPGRRLMGGVDKFNQLTGGPDIGNVSPGAAQAVTPALESLVGEGIIGKAANLFKEGHGSFLDKMGDVYDIGHIYDPGSLVHPEVLEKAGQLAPTGSLEQSLHDLNLIRTRSTPAGETAIEMTQKPSNAQMEQIMALVERRPKTPVSLDLWNMQSATPKAAGQYFPNPSHAIDAIYNFFK
jgi:hypothetical protein